MLCMAAAMIGAFGIGTVFTSSRTLYNDFVQSQGAVNRLLADFKQNELLTGSLLLNPTKESARQLTEALQENKTELMERFEQSEQAGYFGKRSRQPAAVCTVHRAGAPCESVFGEIKVLAREK